MIIIDSLSLTPMLLRAPDPEKPEERLRETDRRANADSPAKNSARNVSEAETGNSCGIRVI